MADAILDRLTATNIFDLRGVVAVVTGGGTVRSAASPRPSFLLSVPCLLVIKGIGLMISTTLMANGAKVYIIGPKQEDLDRCVPR